MSHSTSRLWRYYAEVLGHLIPDVLGAFFFFSKQPAQIQGIPKITKSLSVTVFDWLTTILTGRFPSVWLLSRVTLPLSRVTLPVFSIFCHKKKKNRKRVLHDNSKVTYLTPCKQDMSHFWHLFACLSLENAHSPHQRKEKVPVIEGVVQK